jgi:hypothetical protein
MLMMMKTQTRNKMMTKKNTKIKMKRDDNKKEYKNKN